MCYRLRKHEDSIGENLGKETLSRQASRPRRRYRRRVTPTRRCDQSPNLGNQTQIQTQSQKTHFANCAVTILSVVSAPVAMAEDLSSAVKPMDLGFYWETFVDPADGSPYFYCEATRATQYEVPLPPAVLLPPGWQPHSASDGEVYFFLDVLNTTAWDYPKCSVLLPEPAAIHNDLSVYWETRMGGGGGAGWCCRFRRFPVRVRSARGRSGRADPHTSDSHRTARRLLEPGRFTGPFAFTLVCSPDGRRRSIFCARSGCESPRCDVVGSPRGHRDGGDALCGSPCGAGGTCARCAAGGHGQVGASEASGCVASYAPSSVDVPEARRRFIHHAQPR